MDSIAEGLDADAQPVAPFHGQYAFFPAAGDLVLFPSWLVHKVGERGWSSSRRRRQRSNCRPRDEYYFGL
eukprot:SAG22_NODE_14_length_33165_cov_13.196698_22_plen_70_part_00